MNVKRIMKARMALPYFKVSKSTQAYKTKPTPAELTTAQFVNDEISIDGMKMFLSYGTIFGVQYNQPTHHYSRKGCTKENFKLANCIAVDIDNSDVDLHTYLKALKPHQVPTIAYTTFSNGIEGKGYRFRLLYLLNQDITTVEDFTACYHGIAHELPNCDASMASPSQPYYGTNREATFVLNNRSYNVEPLIEKGKPYLAEKRSHVEGEAQPNTSKREHIQFTKELNNALYKGYDRLLKSFDYEIIRETTENVVDCGNYKLLGEGYISIQQGNGKVEHERSKLFYINALLKRIIKPSITPDELLYNMVFEAVNHFSNADDKFTPSYIKSVVRRVIDADEHELSNLKIKYDTRRFKVADSIENKQAEKQYIKRDMNFERIAKYFTPQKSDRENLATLADNGINISRATLSRFKRARGLKNITKTDKIGELFDPRKTDRQNLAYFEENGLKVSQRMLTKYKANLKKAA